MSSPHLTLDRYQGLNGGGGSWRLPGTAGEGHRTVSRAYINEILTEPPPLIYTDDTAMAMSLTESLLACEGFSGQDMAARFAHGYQTGPYRGYGPSIVDVFHGVLAGTPWDEAASRQHGGQGSFGNGAAMRVAPVALWTGGNGYHSAEWRPTPPGSPTPMPSGWREQSYRPWRHATPSLPRRARCRHRWDPHRPRLPGPHRRLPLPPRNPSLLPRLGR